MKYATTGEYQAWVATAFGGFHRHERDAVFDFDPGPAGEAGAAGAGTDPAGLLSAGDRANCGATGECSSE